MKIIVYFFVPMCIYLAKIIPFNWIVGSYATFFSLSSIVAPVFAKYLGISTLFYFLMSWKLCDLTLLLPHVLHRLPLVCASKEYKNSTVLGSIVLPIVCMIAFVCHGNGNAAWIYTLYWLIPPILYFASENIFLNALRSTFIAHAIGSNIWLYAFNLSTEVWIGLIPIVFIERILMAAGIVSFDRIFSFILDYFAEWNNVSLFRKRLVKA